MIDIYKEVTRRIIAELEKGNIPWHCPWRPKDWHNRNLISGKPYRGINQILLCMMPYDSPFWMTLRQLKKLGGELKPDEKGTCVVFWTLFEKDSDTKIPVLRFYRVYNLEQTMGIPAKYIPVLPAKNQVVFDPISNAEEIISGYQDGPCIRHGGNQACYSPSLDLIRMPERIQFDKEEEYYSTLFHEMAHSTGHQSRLNRPGLKNINFGSENYSKEELIAEFGAAFLCAQTGIAHATIQNSGAYIKNWLEKLRNDKKLAIQAAHKAQKAVDYIMKNQQMEEKAA
jgi:antirestriction protein ArdC